MRHNHTSRTHLRGKERQVHTIFSSVPLQKKPRIKLSPSHYLRGYSLHVYTSLTSATVARNVFRQTTNVYCFFPEPFAIWILRKDLFHRSHCILLIAYERSRPLSRSIRRAAKRRTTGRPETALSFPTRSPFSSKIFSNSSSRSNSR